VVLFPNDLFVKMKISGKTNFAMLIPPAAMKGTSAFFQSKNLNVI